MRLLQITLLVLSTSSKCFSFVTPSVSVHVGLPPWNACEKSSSGLLPPTRPQTRLYAAETAEEETITDVDARVLQSMLREKKLDLDTEEDVRKLLERGTVKTVPNSMPIEEEESEFSSQLFKQFADTKLWKKVSMQATEAMESVQIWVSNKVEQDVKVLAALGLFAWDRAVNDVARALPAAGSQVKKTIFAISNTSAYVNDEPKSVSDAMNRPEDEIKTVSRELFGILSGERTAATGRGLRTAAPAGSKNAAERQRRAYTQSKKLDKQKKDVTKVAGSVVDTAWELRKELKAESNVPGYKSKPLRNAIEAGVANTGNILRAARQDARLAASKRQELRLREGNGDEQENDPSRENAVQAAFVEALQESGGECMVAGEAAQRREPAVYNVDFVKTQQVSDDTSDATVGGAKQRPASQKISSRNDDKLRSELLVERDRICSRLKRCIDDPSGTWLKPMVVDRLNKVDLFSGTGLQDAVSKMILLDSEMDAKVAQENDSLQHYVDQLAMLRDSIDDLCVFTAMEVADGIGIELRIELFGMGGKEEPLIFHLDEIKEALEESEDSKEGVFAFTDDEKAPATVFPNEPKRERTDAKTGSANVDHVDTVVQVATAITPDFVDVIPDSIVDVIPEMISVNGEVLASHEATATVDLGDQVDAMGAGLVAELVADDDFDSAVGATKVAVPVTDEEHAQETEAMEDSIVVKGMLRSLDVAFFVVEKVVTVGLPGTVEATKTAATRVADVNREGKGSKGWKTVSNLADTKGRY